MLKGTVIVQDKRYPSSIGLTKGERDAVEALRRLYRLRSRNELFIKLIRDAAEQNGIEIETK